MQSTYVIYRRKANGAPYAVQGAVCSQDARAYMELYSHVNTVERRLYSIPLSAWLSLIK